MLLKVAGLVDSNIAEHCISENHSVLLVSVATIFRVTYDLKRHGLFSYQICVGRKKPNAARINGSNISGSINRRSGQSLAQTLATNRCETCSRRVEMRCFNLRLPEKQKKHMT